MSAELTNFVTVFRTDQRVHLDWAANALEEAGIPYQRRKETPATGTGTGGAVIVPESSVAQAREVLAALPFEQTTAPDMWSFQPKPGAMLGWKIYAVIVISGTVAGLITQLSSALGTNAFVMSGVVAAALVIAFFLMRGGRVASARCPRCLRLGRTNHYGHCHCSACGAVF